MLVVVFLSGMTSERGDGMARLGAEVPEKPRKSHGMPIPDDPQSGSRPARLGNETHCRRWGNKSVLLVMGKGGTTYKLENDKEKVVHDERPLPPVAVRRDTERDSTNGPEHQHERDAPGDVCRRAVELLGERRDCQGYGEEIERIPRLDGVSDGAKRRLGAYAGRRTHAERAHRKKAHCFPVSMRKSGIGF